MLDTPTLEENRGIFVSLVEFLLKPLLKKESFRLVQDSAKLAEEDLVAALSAITIDVKENIPGNGKKGNAV